jgi:hypothetical protein
MGDYWNKVLDIVWISALLMFFLVCVLHALLSLR